MGQGTAWLLNGPDKERRIPMNCPTCGLDIDEHPTNRCLDAWVAEEVMGLNVVSRNWRCGQMPDAGYEAAMYAEEPKYGWGFYNEEGPVYWEDVHDVGWGWPPWVDEDHGDLIACVEPVPFYSAAGIAALSAVDVLIAKGLEFSLGWVKHRGKWLWYAHFSESMFWDDEPESIAESRSLAICRAALKAATKDNVDG